jgi:uncharacterized protein
MKDKHATSIAEELGISAGQVIATVELLDDDATVPFIARYRKEATDNLDEVQITQIRDRVTQLRDLDKRRESILKSLEERNLLTDDLKRSIESAETMAVLEDIYLPYKPKRRTRATIARERGLEPLAELIFTQDDIDVDSIAEEYVDPEKGVETLDDAIAGARDIIAEWISEDPDARSRMRRLFREKAIITSTVAKGMETDGAKYSGYFDWSEPIKGIPSHRYLAMRRGEAESYLRLNIAPPEDDALSILAGMFIASNNQAADQVRLAIKDGYKRLLAPSMETEIRNELKDNADLDAISVFAENVRELLLAPPLGRRNILAIDPGFRTGCKVACLDKEGRLQEHTTIFPHGSDKQRRDAAVEIEALCEQHKINVIAIGNGTAGRETEQFIREIGLPEHISIEMVNEAGASVYSASAVAREEFPDHDITVRGAVSIGRRLMDPLAELVKIDPKSIGVGQYQHDVDQSALKQCLDDTVISCVNLIGIDINTASKQLLAYISGLGPKLAANVIVYRNEQGPFKSRQSLKKVPRLGPKAFEQAAGFLRIAHAKNPLDNTGIHPESYHIVEQMAKDLGCRVVDLMEDESLRERIDLQEYVTDKVGLPTLRDIIDELSRPGRDPRSAYKSFKFDESVNAIGDLKVGMKLPGIVTNVTHFGAFVDIGVHQDGLVHISELTDSSMSPSKSSKSIWRGRG